VCVANDREYQETMEIQDHQEYRALRETQDQEVPADQPDPQDTQELLAQWEHPEQLDGLEIR
jgi:hypothetical protein